MTLYEYKRNSPTAEPFFFVKMGTGIGSGLISDGSLYRGGNGASGDIGHIQFHTENAPLCRCGKVGCVEAYAAGWAIARDLRALGFEARDARDVVALVEDQKPEAIRLIREAGRTLGEVVADVISILNPSTIVIGGTLARVQDLLLAGVKELVYQRCLPLATRNLVIIASKPSEEACLVGAAYSVIDHVFRPTQIDVLLSRYYNECLSVRTKRRRLTSPAKLEGGDRAAE
jgi:predicted NBD/HSP70 family sugar kinase